MRKSTDAVITCALAGITANELVIPAREPSTLVNPRPTRRQVPRLKSDALLFNRTGQTAGSFLSGGKPPGSFLSANQQSERPLGASNKRKGFTSNTIKMTPVSIIGFTLDTVINAAKIRIVSWRGNWPGNRYLLARCLVVLSQPAPIKGRELPCRHL